jgi:large subunit ribosomal protein L29
MKAKELRQFTYTELRSRLDQAKQELFNLRFQREVGQLEDVTRVRTVRRNVARILTVMREKELEAETNG